MLELATVTLLAVDTANHRLALRALACSSQSIRFARKLLLTDALPDGLDAPADVEIARIDPVLTRDAYSEFVLKRLAEFVTTDHVLLVQWDGYVVNAAAWLPSFLACDYIGAKWFWQPPGLRVGNGGFSLRSNKLLRATRDPRITLTEAEDVTIGRVFRPLLEREFGIRYADEALADRFAFEAAYPIGMPFGFHGLYNFCRVMPQQQLADIAASFSDAIAASPQLAQLLRNCISLGQWTAATALARRRLAAIDDNEARALMAQAEAAAARGPVVGRNDPCPCGSGKRYKQCHGDIANSTGSPVAANDAAKKSAHGADHQLQRALSAHQRGELGEAEEIYRAILAQDGNNAMALHYLGVVAYQRNQPQRALPLLVRAIARTPGEPEFHNNLGLVLTALDRYDDAITAFAQALKLQPRHAGALTNLGLAQMAARKVTDAIASHRKAIAIAAEHAPAHWNLALALLASGNYAEGWREYEWRLAVPEFRSHASSLSSPRWHGESVAGKTVLLTREQGLGDTLQFIRFAGDLAQRGARVVVQAPEPLVRLVATAPGVAEVCLETRALPAHDVHVALLSLPHLLGITEQRIGVPVPYISVDGVLRASVAADIATIRGGRRAIGVAWGGAPGNTLNPRRSIPLRALTPLLQMPDIAWFSLQKGEAEQQMAGLEAARHLAVVDAHDDFPGIAAMIAALDLVITVDTSIAHLAGAMGKPVWVMLAFAADWRWGHAETTPWYPTARLIRQVRPGDWQSVVDSIGAALRASTRVA